MGDRRRQLREGNRSGHAVRRRDSADRRTRSCGRYRLRRPRQAHRGGERFRRPAVPDLHLRPRQEDDRQARVPRCRWPRDGALERGPWRLLPSRAVDEDEPWRRDRPRRPESDEGDEGLCAQRLQPARDRHRAARSDAAWLQPRCARKWRKSAGAGHRHGERQPGRGDH